MGFGLEICGTPFLVGMVAVTKSQNNPRFFKMEENMEAAPKCVARFLHGVGSNGLGCTRASRPISKPH